MAKLVRSDFIYFGRADFVPGTMLLHYSLQIYMRNVSWNFTEVWITVHVHCTEGMSPSFPTSCLARSAYGTTEPNSILVVYRPWNARHFQ